jgi:acyl-CoA reductase-like NAD-dependent aldehyde dehydrogenase
MNPAVAVEKPKGTPAHRDVEGTLPPTPKKEIDAALDTLAACRDEWTAVPIPDRRAILRELIKDFSTVAERWAKAVCEAEGIDPDSHGAGEEWLAGPYFILRNLRLLEQSLGEIESHGEPRIPGPVETRPDGQVVARVFPHSIYDRIFYSGFTAEVWMQPGVTAENLPRTQAAAYKEKKPEGRVCLVLGAGNVSSIGPMDILYKLFVENRVVIVKMHPLNAYLGPLLAEGFQALIDWQALRIVYGGAEEGAYLCEHPEVGEIHITGSDKTVEAIVFGPGEEGRKRKAERRPKLKKPISSELGNVSPLIVVPGPWSASDLRYQAEQIASSLINNAGFNCNATRVIVQHAEWPQRRELLDAVRDQLRHSRPRVAFYPGAQERHSAFVAEHPEAEHYGDVGEGELPWTLIPDVDPGAEGDICFRTEAFCGLFCESAVSAGSVAEYLARAVELANEGLWGTLNCTLLVHPASLRDAAVAEAFDRAVAELRYGTIAVNAWAAIGYGLVIPPWGAYPGHDLYDIESGSGVVHNTLMFERPQKTVLRTPFRITPKPIWFQSHQTAAAIGRKLTEFEADPSPLKLPGIFWEALRG